MGEPLLQQDKLISQYGIRGDRFYEKSDDNAILHQVLIIIYTTQHKFANQFSTDTLPHPG